MRTFIIERAGVLDTISAPYDLRDENSDQSCLDAYYCVYDEEWKDSASIIMEVTPENMVSLLKRLKKSEAKIVSLKRNRK